MAEWRKYFSKNEESQAPAEVPNTSFVNFDDEDEYEGQLSLDVYHDNKYVYIKSTIAGVKAEDIDIAIENDLVTIRGKREQEEMIKGSEYLYQECYWGSFSRTVVLPIEVDASRSEASLKNGVLTLRIPKMERINTVNVKVNEEDEDESGL